MELPPPPPNFISTNTNLISVQKNYLDTTFSHTLTVFERLIDRSIDWRIDVVA